MQPKSSVVINMAILYLRIFHGVWVSSSLLWLLSKFPVHCSIRHSRLLGLSSARYHGIKWFLSSCAKHSELSADPEQSSAYTSVRLRWTCFIFKCRLQILLDAINQFDGGIRQVDGPNATAHIFATYPKPHLGDLLGTGAAVFDQVCP